MRADRQTLPGELMTIFARTLYVSAVTCQRPFRPHDHLESDMRIHELLDIASLDAEIEAGYVRVQHHPTEPLMILNYTAQAQWDNHWNVITETCRGLIVNTATGDIVARPFRKFFNLSQLDPADQDALALAEDAGGCVITEKMDGSLGILYWQPSDGRWAVATRGSFSSEQALHATALFQAQYERHFRPQDGLTYLVEIIYPANRIVVDYADRDDLTLLAVVNITTGRSLQLDYVDSTWPGRVVERHEFVSFTDAIAIERSNSEGFVLYFPTADRRVKVKHDEYVRLHRIITNASSKTIWECLASGTSFEQLLEAVPDEFYAWVQQTRDDLQLAYQHVVDDAIDALVDVVGRLPVETADISQLLTPSGCARWAAPTREVTRREFAEEAKAHPLAAFIFTMFDNKDAGPLAWKKVRPANTKPFANVSEDVA